MLGDAIRAEGYRLSKNRTALFWSLAFVPIVAVAIGVLTNLVLKSGGSKLLVNGEAPPELGKLMLSSPLDLGHTMVAAAGSLANPVILLFVLIGAATIYAGDYRWESWRLISARNSRTNLLLGKLAVVAGMSLVAMLLMLAAGLTENLIKAAVFERPLLFSITGPMLGQFFGQLALSWLRIVQFTMMGMLAAVVTRSLLAALFVPLVVGVAQFFSPNLLMPMGLAPDSWLAVLINPGSAVDTVSALIAGGVRAAAVADGLPLKAWLSMALWTFAPLALSIVWFKRQDLSKE